jgi:FkbM family methyltransferase
MLIDLKYLIKKYNLNIRGIIQVGSHWAEEYEDFKKQGVLFFVFIEPCVEAFNVIKDKVSLIHLDKTNSTFVSCFNRAMSDYEGTAFMNIETKNNGQSNSLLNPKKHLISYPDILFNREQEEVRVATLDSLDFDIFGREQTNMLVMDTQGTELSVLKGATETLKYIDYIYTEINTDEVYENCCRVEEIDNYLNDFIRVETKLTNQSWGDALYLAKRLLK